MLSMYLHILEMIPMMLRFTLTTSKRIDFKKDKKLLIMYTITWKLAIVIAFARLRKNTDKNFTILSTETIALIMLRMIPAIKGYIDIRMKLI